MCIRDSDIIEHIVYDFSDAHLLEMVRPRNSADPRAIPARNSGAQFCANPPHFSGAIL